MKCLAIAANGRRKLLQEAGADLVVEDFSKTALDDARRLFCAVDRTPIMCDTKSAFRQS